MKRISTAIILLAAIAAFNPAFAQGRHQGKAQNGKDFRAQLSTEKIGYITTKLELTEAEAQQFWPVYNKVDKARGEALKEVRTAFKELNKSIQDGGDCAKLLTAYLDAQVKVNDLEKKSVAEYSKVLPAEKVAKLFIAEEQFRKDMMSSHRPGPKHPQDGKPEPKPQPQER